MRAKYVTIEVASGRGAAERWRGQYGRDWPSTATGSSKAIYERLCKLGPNPPIDQVAEIIGNKSWSYITCNGCMEYIERAVRIGGDYGDSHVYCTTCISEAHQALIGETK